MAQKIYVGNMSFKTTEATLEKTFSQFGEVLSATVIRDRNTDQSKGFGFVEMAQERDAQNAIHALHGKDLEGRRVRVNFAEEKPPRRPREFQ